MPDGDKAVIAKDWRKLKKLAGTKKRAIFLSEWFKCDRNATQAYKNLHPNVSDEVLVIKAEDLVKKSGKASTSFIQRMLRIGYVRAATIMDKLEEKGIVTQQKGNMRTREVISETVELPQDYRK